MQVAVECSNNSGFEDQLTTGKQYEIVNLSPCGSEVTIKNDLDEVVSYGTAGKLNLVMGKCTCR